jgi:phosphoribosylglycinamide formyltransferase 2
MVSNRGDRFGTPLFEGSVKAMFLGGGELGKEMVIEAQRLGVETVVVDRYHNPPAAQLAHRSYTVDMKSKGILKALAYRERPDVIVPEIEALSTEALVELEEEGFDVIPSAKATRIAMDRFLMRRLAVEKAGVKTSRFAEANNLDELKDACEKVGYPCFVKARMSSGGLGSTLVKDKDGIASAYENSRKLARGSGEEMIVEAIVPFDLEVTELVLAHADGRVSLCRPVGHVRSGSHFHSSWQPFVQAGRGFQGFGSELHRAEDPPRGEMLWTSGWNGKDVPEELAARVENEIYDVAKRFVGSLPDSKNSRKKGIFGCELFVCLGDEAAGIEPSVYFNEASPRPHDTGMVTIVTQELSEMALHVRAILGLPVPKINLLTNGASHVILARKEAWAVKYGGVANSLSEENCRLLLFGKPLALPDRRMGLVIVPDDDVNEARSKACRVAHQLEAGIVYE